MCLNQVCQTRHGSGEVAELAHPSEVNLQAPADDATFLNRKK
jgi:hypothetical protein